MLKFTRVRGLAEFVAETPTRDLSRRARAAGALDREGRRSPDRWFPPAQARGHRRGAGARRAGHLPGGEVSWMEFVATVSASLAWPIAVLVVILVLRKEFRK